MAQMTTVSQNTPVMDTRACFTGEVVLTDTALMGSDPIPASLVKSPLEIPTRIVQIIDCPPIPPMIAFLCFFLHYL